MSACACVPNARAEARFEPCLDREPFVQDDRDAELTAARAIVERDDADRAEMLAFGYAGMLRENAARAVPMAICRGCGYPFGDDQASWFWKGLCCTCEINQMEDLIRKVVKRHGRHKALRLLKRLAR